MHDPSLRATARYWSQRKGRLFLVGAFLAVVLVVKGVVGLLT